MRMGLLTRNPRAWCSFQLIKAMERRDVEPISFRFSDLSARVSCKPEVTLNGHLDLVKELGALIVRPIGRGSLDEIIFRLDLLHRLERLGLPIINPPSSIERAVDKYYALTLMEERGIPVPRTVVTESVKGAMDAFYELGGDVVVKPLFGSRGIGITRVSDPEVAGRVFRSLQFVHHVLYVQEFIPHGTRDIRAFVVGDRVVAAMYRVAEGWKTNVSQGAKPIPLRPKRELEELSVGAVKALGCVVAGVDVLEGPGGYLVSEVNSQPGFQGLQSTTLVDIAGKIVDYILTNIC
ncbi:MAG: RimK family alpha-L-glutamate ligase [Candidatus Bathyarchaeia archaeon]